MSQIGILIKGGHYEQIEIEIEITVMAMTIRPSVMKKRITLAQTLVDDNGGKLPNPWKMIQQGHGGLYRYIQRHPDEFSHFIVEEAVGKEPTHKRMHFNVSIRNEHLDNAKRLAIENDGVVPDISWMMQHGHTRLASYMKTYPYVFVDLDLEPKTSKHKIKLKKK